MSDKIGLLTGSFDPVTNGHMDIIERASKLFDKLYIGIFYNKDKQGFFTIEERQKMLEESVQGIENVKVITARDSLAVDIAKRLGVTYMVRGIRSWADMDYEANLSFYNKHLAEEIETVFLLSSLELTYVTSSRIRELIYFKSDISAFVPNCVVKEVEKKRDNTKKI
jgi:pantetheine-phosphate adenylyltransferase